MRAGKKNVVLGLVMGLLVWGGAFWGWAQSNVVQVFFEDFDTSATDCRVDAVFPGWTIGDGGSCTTPPGNCNPNMYTATWTVRNASVPGWCNTAPLAGQVAELYYNTCYHMDTLVTPVVNLSGYGGAKLSFTHVFYLYTSNYGYVEVFDGAQWVRIDSFGAIAGGNDCGRKEYEVSQWAGGNANFQVRFVYYDNWDWYWRIDSVRILAFPCGMPGNLMVYTTCPDTLKVVWDTTYGGDSVYIEFGQAGFAFGSGTRLQFANNAGMFDTTLPTGTYDVYVWGKCNVDYSDTVKFTVKVNTLPYLESFAQGAGGWTFSGSSVAYLDGAPGCGGTDSFITLRGQAGAYAESPPICLPAGACKVRVSYIFRDGDFGCGEDPDPGEQVVAEVSFDGGVTWTTLATYDGGTEWSSFTYDEHLVNVPPGATNILVRFRVLSGSGACCDTWHFDSVAVVAADSLDLAVVAAQFRGCPGDSMIVCVQNQSCNTAYFTGTDTMWLNVAVWGTGLTPDTVQYVVVGDSLEGDSTMCVNMGVVGGAADTVQWVAWLVWAPDTRASNDMLQSGFFAQASPFREDFGTNWWSDVATLNTGWWEARGPCCNPLNGMPGNWTWISDNWYNTGATNQAAKINLWTSVRRDWIVAPPVVISTDSPEILFKFDLGIWAWGTQTPDQLGTDDSLVVVYSQDCGLTWNVLAVWDSSNTPIGDSLVYRTSLPNTSGYFWVAFWGSEGVNNDPADNDVMVDDINIEALNRDIGGLALILYPSDDTVCRGQTVQANVNIINYGDVTQDSIYIHAWNTLGDVYLDTLFVALPVGNTLPLTVFSFPMPAQPSVTIWVVVRALPWDGNPTNDTLTVTIYRTPPPQTVLIAPDTVYVNTTVSVGLFPMGTPYTQVLWDFGPNAIPQSASGIGPINVRWTQTGWQPYRILVTYCNNGDSLWIYDSVFVRRLVTGVEDLVAAGGVQVLDNGRGQPVLVSQTDRIERVRMYDTRGRLLFEAKPASQRWLVPMDVVSAGVYIVEVYLSDGRRARLKVK